MANKEKVKYVIKHPKVITMRNLPSFCSPSDDWTTAFQNKNTHFERFFRFLRQYKPIMSGSLHSCLFLWCSHFRMSGQTSQFRLNNWRPSVPNKGLWRAWFDVLCVSIEWGWRVHFRDPSPCQDLRMRLWGALFFTLVQQRLYFPWVDSHFRCAHRLR